MQAGRWSALSTLRVTLEGNVGDPFPPQRGQEELADSTAPGPRPLRGAPPTDAPSPPPGSRVRGRGSPLPSGSPGLRQSASALLAVRSSRAPPPPAGLRFPESKMAGSRQRGPQARVRPLFCALLLSLSRFAGGDGMGGDPAAAGTAGTGAASPHRRFEYKYSFKGPHLVQSDGTVPFWAHAGSKPGKRAGGQGLLPALRLLLSTLSLLHSAGAVDPSQQPLLQVGSGPQGSLRLRPTLTPILTTPRPPVLL